MNKKALLIAVTAAVIGTVMIFLYLRRYEREVAGGALVEVVIAIKDLPLGGVVSEDSIAFRDMPQAYLEGRHIRASEVQRILGVRVSSPVRANESLLWSDLAATTADRRDLSHLVRPGMRAMSIRADVTSSFGGLLRPGDRVDVLLTLLGADGVRRTITLLQRILVLAAGDDIGGNNQGGPSTSRKIKQVTVSVDPEEAQILAYTAGNGQLTLVLRNPEDLRIREDMPEATSADVVHAERRLELTRRSVGMRRRPPAAPADPGTSMIERIGQ